MKNIYHIGLLIIGFAGSLQANVDCSKHTISESSHLISTEEKVIILENLLKEKVEFEKIRAVACDVTYFDELQHRFSRDYAIRKIIELAIQYNHKELLENAYDRADWNSYDQFRLNPKVRFAWALNYLCSLDKSREDFAALRDIILKLTPNDKDNLYPIDACGRFCIFGLCAPQDAQVEELCQIIEQRIDKRNENARKTWFDSLR